MSVRLNSAEDARGEEARRQQPQMTRRRSYIMRRNRFLLVLATCLLSIAVVPGRSSAKDCGGAIKCACGDTVQAGLGVAVLDGDLGVCEGLGLGMTTGSVLDCAGHTITGTDRPGAWYGIELDSVSGAQV